MWLQPNVELSKVTLGPPGPREINLVAAPFGHRHESPTGIYQSISQRTNPSTTNLLKNLNRINQSVMKHPDSMHIPVCNGRVSASQVFATLFANAESTLTGIQHTDTQSWLSPHFSHGHRLATKCTTGYQVVQRFGTFWYILCIELSHQNHPLFACRRKRFRLSLQVWVFQTSLLLTRVSNRLRLQSLSTTLVVQQEVLRHSGSQAEGFLCAQKLAENILLLVSETSNGIERKKP